MKIFAFYLPQFHEIKENNEWWGKGFTEWTNVKAAISYFKGHQQPKEPLNKNYYDLSEIDSIRSQCKLANQYGLTGFCFYHYWFEGKLLLEKPSEILLRNKDIETQFFFSWANEPWTRSWDGKNKSIIMPQGYSNKDDWYNHIIYLLEFFKDSRYLKINNSPVFFVYKPSEIKYLGDMLEFWNEILKKNGFNGLYLVNTLRGQKDDKRSFLFNANVQFEPAYTQFSNNPKLNTKRLVRFFKKMFPFFKHNLNLYDISDVYSRSIRSRPIDSKKTFNGAFVDWDNTPRRNINGTVFKNFSIKKFENYIKNKLISSKKYYNSNLFLINAWNEWAEGAFLEGDEHNKLGKLEVISKLKKSLKHEKTE